MRFSNCELDTNTQSRSSPLMSYRMETRSPSSGIRNCTLIADLGATCCAEGGGRASPTTSSTARIALDPRLGVSSKTFGCEVFPSSYDTSETPLSVTEVRTLSTMDRNGSSCRRAVPLTTRNREAGDRQSLARKSPPSMCQKTPQVLSTLENTPLCYSARRLWRTFRRL
jgi:hypothetical protein